MKPRPVPILLVAMLTMFAAMLAAGCASVQRDWKTTCMLDVADFYVSFIKRHPNSEHCTEARSRIAELEKRNEEVLALLKSSGIRWVELLRFVHGEFNSHNQYATVNNPAAKDSIIAVVRRAGLWSPGSGALTLRVVLDSMPSSAAAWEDGGGVYYTDNSTPPVVLGYLVEGDAEYPLWRLHDALARRLSNDIERAINGKSE